MPIHQPKKRERKREPGILKEISSSLERRVSLSAPLCRFLGRDAEVEQITVTPSERGEACC